MKASLTALLAAVLAGVIGCSSSGPSAPAAKTAAQSKTEKADEDAKQTERSIERAKELLGLQAPADVPGETGEPETETIVDPETGKKVLRIRKQILYYEKDGRLFNAVVVGPGLPILRQDEKAYYVLAPPDPPKRDPSKAGAEPDDLKPIVELPASEAALVTPKIRKGAFRFEEISEGLPRAGMWRENFDVGDLLGQGRPQIVAPPARLTGNFIRVYRLDKGDGADSKWQWRLADLTFENEDKLQAAYGAVTLADMDGDGVLDIVYGGHGAGPAIAFNKGGGTFKIETRGLPRQMSTRAIAAGDLNGDGRQDLLVISDDPEWIETHGKPQTDTVSGYVKGYDIRAFLNDGARFREVHKGLEGACFGYAIALVVPKDAKDGLPFFSSACRYTMGASHLYEFDPKLEEFRYAGVGVVELWAQHMGSAAGTYRGRPAAFATWFKRSPFGAMPKIDGQGITVYYRGADGKMAAKRIVKTLQFDAGSPAIAVGDLDGDGLDDVVWCDESTHRMRVFFQMPDGEFEELAADREPTFVNHPTSLRITDFDGDGHMDVALMYQFLTGDETRAGGFRVFRGLSK